MSKFKSLIIIFFGSLFTLIFVIFGQKLIPVKAATDPFIPSYSQKQITVGPTMYAVPQGNSNSSSWFSVNIDPKKTLSPISPYLTGLNVNVNETPQAWSDPKYVKNIQDVQSKLIRWPGGSNSNTYRWKDHIDEPGGAKELAGLLSKTRSQAVITLNLGSYRNDINQGIRDAADLVNYFNGYEGKWAERRIQDGFKNPVYVKYFVLGNENFGNWENGTCNNYPNATKDDCSNRYSGTTYAKVFELYQSELKRMDPSVLVGATMSGEDNGDYSKSWDGDVLKEAKGRIDFYDIHFYSVHSQWLNKFEIINNSAVNTDKRIKDFRTIIQKYGFQSEQNKPIFIGEYNAAAPIYFMLTQDSTSHISSLALANMIGSMASNGISGAAYWSAGLIDWNPTQFYWGYNLFTKNVPNTPDLTPHPTYYALYLWSKMGDTLIANKSSDPNVYSYASAFSDGSESIMLINNSEQNKSVTVDFGQKVGDVNSWVLDAPSYDSTKTYLNGQTVESGQFGGPNIDKVTPYYQTVNNTMMTHSVPARSVILIQAKKDSWMQPKLWSFNMPSFRAFHWPWWE